MFMISKTAIAPGVRIALFYTALFFGLGIFLPFFPVWLKEQGLNATQISYVLAAQMVVRIGSGPAFTFLADARDDRRGVLIALSVASLGCIAFLSAASGFAAILLLSVLASLLWTPIMPLIDSLAIMESEAGRSDYGRTRLWGSLSFIAGSVGGGFALRVYEADLIIWFLVLAYALTAIASFLVPADSGRREASPQPLRLVEVVPILRHPLFLAFIAAASLIQASHALYYGFGTIHWRSSGIAEDVIGALWAIGVIAEVVLFAFSRQAVRLTGATGLVLIGAVAAVVRWTFTAADPGVEWLFLIQIGHGLSFGATHLGTMHFIARATRRDLHATAQGIYAAISSGIVMAAVMSGCGWLYGAYGADGYLAMAVLGLVAGVAALVVVLRWDGDRLA